MAALLNTLKRQLERQNLATRSSEARNWLIKKVKELRGSTTVSLTKDRTRRVDDFTVGKMYFFSYDAKGKKTLPYYDRFPLVLPIEQYSDGFLGLNLHYVPPNYRAMLLDSMMDIISNKRFDESTRFRASYSLLNGSSRYHIFKPCVKRYLYTQMRSKFISIDASEWDIAIFLPFERFVGAGAGTVFNDSLGKI